MSSGGELSGLEILLVEDEPLIGTLISEWLAENGAEMRWVPTDTEAYRLLEDDRDTIDVLITDINLRLGTTGFDVARFGRKLNDRLPVIYLSGEAIDAGNVPNWCVDRALFLTKPVRPGQLINAILESRATLAPEERLTIRAGCRSA